MSEHAARCDARGQNIRHAIDDAAPISLIPMPAGWSMWNGGVLCPAAAHRWSKPSCGRAWRKRPTNRSAANCKIISSPSIASSPNSPAGAGAHAPGVYGGPSLHEPRQRPDGRASLAGTVA